MPPSHCRVERLEDLDFERYREIAEFMGWRPLIDTAAFADLARARPNSGPNPPRRFIEWNSTEAAEFEAEVAAVAEALEYEYRVRNLTNLNEGREEKSRLALTDVLERLFG